MATPFPVLLPMKPALSLFPLLLAFAFPLHATEAPPDARATARAELQQLVEHFRRAIIDKDGEAMRAMFLPGGSWLQGLDAASLAAVRASKPEAKQFHPGDYEKFARFVGTSPAANEEIFDHVRIETDGTVGMVFFDYRFITDGRQTNHGAETWQVVREHDGWKISAMLYSITPDDNG